MRWTSKNPIYERLNEVRVSCITQNEATVDSKASRRTPSRKSTFPRTWILTLLSEHVVQYVPSRNHIGAGEDDRDNDLPG